MRDVVLVKNCSNRIKIKKIVVVVLTPVVEKTKTQAQNSSQKLKEKTQPQGGTFLLLRETQEKNSISPIFL